MVKRYNESVDSLATDTRCTKLILLRNKIGNELLFKKYKTFSVLIYSYINTSGNWKNEKLCGNTTPAGRSVFTQFRVFPIFTSVHITVYQYGKNVLYFFYNIAQRTLTKEWRKIFRVVSQSAFRIYKCYIINIFCMKYIFELVTFSYITAVV